MEKIWVLKLKTCAKFLLAINLHLEAAELANKRGWAVAMTAAEKNKERSIMGRQDGGGTGGERRPASLVTATSGLGKRGSGSNNMSEMHVAIKKKQTEMVALKNIGNRGLVEL